MSIQQDLYDYLNGSAGIMSAMTIAWVDSLETSQFPVLTFKRISAPVTYQADDQYQRWRFFVASKTKTNAQAIGDELEEALNRYQGQMGNTYIGYITKVEESPLELWDDGIYRVFFDYKIIFC